MTPRTVAVLVTVSLALAQVIWGQGLVYSPPPLLDTSAAGDDPWVMRSVGAAPMRWQGRNYLISSTGNELRLWDVSDPEHPSFAGQTGWHVPPFGDRDYNLFNFAVCDDCRYGIAGFQSCGTVLFSLGELAVPHWGEYRRYPDARSYGGVVYRHGGQQYLLAAGLRDVCQGGGAVYRISGVEPEQLELVNCLLAGTSAISTDGGVYLPGDPTHVWVVTGTRSHVYRVEASGWLTWTGEGPRAAWIRAVGLAVDGTLAATASAAGSYLWDASDPEHLVQLAELPQPTPTFDYDSVVLGDGRLVGQVLGGQGGQYIRTFDVTDPAHPVELDPGFWDTGNAWNAYTYGAEVNAVLLGDWLILSRWSVLQRYAWSPPVTDSVFAAGFESGSTAAWSLTQP